MPDDDSGLDSFNRANRSFNFWMLDHVFEPVSRGYNFAMPKWGQARVSNLLENLQRPRDFVNSVLQFKLPRAGRHLGAFVVNSTVGIAGMFNVADHFIDVESPETTGETLGVYGIPPGPYLILPFYGETSPRGLVGAVGDAALNPLFWIPGSAGVYASAGARGLDGINLLAGRMPPPCSSDSEWDAYYQLLRDRTPYPDGKRLYFENLQLDVED